MNRIKKSGDGSGYYRDATALRIVRLDTTAAIGNLFDAMKGGPVTLDKPPEILHPIGKEPKTTDASGTERACLRRV